VNRTRTQALNEIGLGSGCAAHCRPRPASLSSFGLVTALRRLRLA
jgi:hypothetical protein